MAQKDLKKYQPYIIIGIIILFALLTFWTRGIPSEGLITAEGVNLLGNDPWYNLRQVEQTVANFPGYAWFDAMTFYPTGDVIYWGPLFIQIISALCILAGAATRPEIMVVASWVPPLMAAAMVPVTYLLAKKLADWKTGLIAAGLIAVIGSNYAYRSLFGFVDHHIAETLFSTFFVLAYVVALLAARDITLSRTNLESLKMPAITAAFAGVAYLLGYLVMPTMILFALIVAAFTLVQFTLDFFKGRSSDYLVFVNTVTFAVVIIGTVAFGFPHPGLDLSLYSFGHVVACVALIGGTLALYGLSVFLRERPNYYFPAALLGVAVLAVAVLYVALPEIYNLLISNLIAFFGEAPITTTVQEARAWSFDAAWASFHWGLVLAAGGAAALIWQSREKVNAAHVFVLIWTAVILASTAAHVRYEYYFAANVALLAAVFAGAVIDATWKDVARLVRPGVGGGKGSSASAIAAKQETPAKKGKKGGKAPDARKPKGSGRGQPDHLKAGIFVVVVGITLIFAGISLSGNIALAASAKYSGMNSDWMEALEWMGANTPDPGVDYHAIYDKETFVYPEESYGVMSWWDYGHWITFISKRIPNNNPFQHGVTGPNGSAAYFVSTDEAAANRILDNIGTRYVITDIQLDTGKFHAPATWADPDVGAVRFQPNFIIPSATDSSSGQITVFNNQEYYLTMISRLHNFDGSMTDPSSQVIYAEYRDAANTSYPVIIRTEMMEAAEGAAAVEAYNMNAQPGTGATLLGMYYQYQGDSILHPLERVPALQHYRLIHETQGNVYGNVGEDGPDLKYVKIFEYVPGATIRGEGIIEVPIVTNAGRTFTYRQESVNGTFIVPYATGGTGEVRATGQYRITDTGQVFDVTEEDVRQGRTIN